MHLFSLVSPCCATQFERPTDIVNACHVQKAAGPSPTQTRTKLNERQLVSKVDIFHFLRFLLYEVYGRVQSKIDDAL